MRLFALVLPFNLHLCQVFATFPDSPTHIWSAGSSSTFNTVSNQNLNGYECGDVFFSDPEVNEALSVALGCVDKGFTFPQRYEGLLYGDAKAKEYLLWPIRKVYRFLPRTRKPETTFRIVFTRIFIEGIDVIAKVTTKEYTRCIRRGVSHLGLSTAVTENPNGYLCAHRFISDKYIQVYLLHAMKRIKLKNIRLAFYLGDLYPRERELRVLSIPVDGVPKYWDVNAGTYYLLIDKNGIVIDAVVRGFGLNLLRCERSRELQDTPSDSYSELLVPNSKSGYQCGKSFFEDKVIDKTIEDIKKQTSKGTKLKEKSRHSFDVSSLIWPIFRCGSIFRTGAKGPYRLVLTQDFKLITATIVINGKLEPCEKITKSAERNHDTSDYVCLKRYFKHKKLLGVAEQACDSLESNQNHFFPARYEGSGFAKDGPYFTFPILTKGNFDRKPGRDRVVINSKCEIVGALTTFTDLYRKRKLVKCHRMDDGPYPLDFYERNHETVFEYRATY